MHALGANLRKLPGQAKICTPPGGAVVAKICKLSHFSDRGFTNSPIQTRETVESTHLQNIIARRLGAATFYTRGNFVAGAVQFGSLLVFLLDLNFTSSPSSRALRGVFACENLHSSSGQNGPTCENMHWRLPGSGLRKYAHPQNHTIPV